MKQIRNQIFETNSSSTHNLTIGEEVSEHSDVINISLVHLCYEDEGLTFPAPWTMGFAIKKPYVNNYSGELTKEAQKELERLAANQTVDERASGLFTLVVCMCPERMADYMDSLSKIVKKIKIDNREFSWSRNTPEYWENRIKDARWGEYESPVWTETHETSLPVEILERVIEYPKRLERFLFGKGSYLVADRNG